MKTAQAVLKETPKEPLRPEPKGFRRTIRSWASDVWDVASGARGREQEYAKLAKLSGIFTKEGPVEVRILDLNWEQISKRYVGYRIKWIMDRMAKKGKYLKEIPICGFLSGWGIENSDVTDREIAQFKRDVDEAAKTDPKVAEFLAKYPEFNQ